MYFRTLISKVQDFGNLLIFTHEFLGLGIAHTQGRLPNVELLFSLTICPQRK